MPNKFPRVNPAPTILWSGYWRFSLHEHGVDPRSNEQGAGCGVNVDILVIRKNKILLGLLSEVWLGNKKQVYGVQGRDIYFN